MQLNRCGVWEKGAAKGDCRARSTDGERKRGGAEGEGSVRNTKFGTVERHPSRGVKRLSGLNPNVINTDTPKMAERTVHQYGFL